MPEDLRLLALRGIGEVAPGDDLARTVLAALAASGHRLADGDVLVVSSKVVSKAAGLVHTAPRDEVVAAQTLGVVARRRVPHGVSAVVRSAAGPVMAAAGVDTSNTAVGTVLSLPPDPDGAARDLRRALREQGAPRVAVLISDTAGRPWRRGQTDFALGAAGLVVLDDLRGTADGAGRPLEVTEPAVADELASAADLVKGKVSGTPVALVRGFGRYVSEDDGPGAAALLREPAGDWFRLGHVEAVRAALGVGVGAGSGPGDVEPPSVLPEPVAHRARRAVAVAAVGLPPAVRIDLPPGPGLRAELTGDPFWCGVAGQRLLAALWAEDLAGTLLPPVDGGPVAVDRIRPATDP